MEETAAMKEDTMQELKIAKIIATKSKHEAKDQILRKHTYSSVRIDIITKQHKMALERHWDDTMAVQSHTQAQHKSILAQIQAICLTS